MIHCYDSRKIECCNCGRNFTPGNDPETGRPNGYGIDGKSGKVYDVCSDCYETRLDEVSDLIRSKEGVGVKMFGRMCLPEDFDVADYEKELNELGTRRLNEEKTRHEMFMDGDLVEFLDDNESIGLEMNAAVKACLVHKYATMHAETLLRDATARLGHHGAFILLAESFYDHYMRLLEDREIELAVMGGPKDKEER